MTKLKSIIILISFIISACLWQSEKEKQLILDLDSSYSIRSLNNYNQLLRNGLKNSKLEKNECNILEEMLLSIQSNNEDMFCRKTRKKLKSFLKIKDIRYSEWQNNASLLRSIIDYYGLCESPNYSFKKMVAKQLNEINEDSLEIELVYFNSLQYSDRMVFRDGIRKLSNNEINEFHGNLEDVSVKFTNKINSDSLIIKSE